MDTKLLIYLISAIFTIIWAVLIYFFKKNDKKKDDCIAELYISRNQHTADIIKLQGELKTLNGKLWEESKLEKLIKSAIKSEFMEWELRLMKEGALKPGG